MDRQPRSILVTGASSGIGAALAKAYAAPGATLFLGGRDAGRLAAVARACRERGAVCRERVRDVTDARGMAAWVRACDDLAPLDLAIANAGVSAGSGSAGENAGQTRRVLAVNVDGALNTVLPVLPAMVARGRGQIALMSSLAGFRGLPGAPAYCASKAMLRVWGEGQRAWLRDKGVRLSVICPGFVRTPMSDGNPYPMPFLMEADRAAEIVKRELARDRARIAFPRRTYWAVRLLAALPAAFGDALFRRLPNKPSADP